MRFQVRAHRISKCCAVLGLLLVLTLLPMAGTAKAKEGAVGPARVALLYFDYGGENPEMLFLRKSLTHMLITDISGDPAVQVVERNRLEEILRELKLGKSGYISPSTRNRIGRLLGARYLISGGFFVFRDTLRIDATIIDVERGINHGVSAEASLTDFMAAKDTLASGLRSKLHLLNSQAFKPAKAKAKAKRRTKGSKARIPVRTAVRFGRALDAKDAGNTKVALRELKMLREKSPEFRPAAEELKELLK